jgi:hypothetical protein
MMHLYKLNFLKGKNLTMGKLKKITLIACGIFNRVDQTVQGSAESAEKTFTIARTIFISLLLKISV